MDKIVSVVPPASRLTKQIMPNADSARFIEGVLLLSMPLIHGSGRRQLICQRWVLVEDFFV
jgi:hypothetical protein